MLNDTDGMQIILIYTHKDVVAIISFFDTDRFRVAPVIV